MNLHPTEKFALLLQKGDAGALASAVEGSREELEAAGEARFLQYWRGRAALLQDDVDTALRLADDTDDARLRSHLQILAHRATAERGGSPAPLFAQLSKEYDVSGTATLLYDLCEAHLRFDDSQFVIDHNEELLRRVPTVAALSLVVQAFLGTNKLTALVKLLESSGDFFPSGELPLELLRMKRDCQQRLGYLAAAREQGENVAAASGRPEDFFRLVHLHRQTADFAKASVAARKVLTHPASEPEHLIATAQAVLAHDSNLSRQLLDKALTAESLAPSVGAAGFFLAHVLGHEEAARRLAPKMEEASHLEGSGVTAFSDEQIVSFLRERGTHVDDVQREYARGRAPLHFLLEMFGGSFPRVFQDIFHPASLGASRWVPRPTYFARHGGRTLEEEPQGFKRLLIDITGLLIADELDLLGLIEESFTPIVVPPSLVPLLTDFLDNNQSPTARRRSALEEILRLFEADLLHATPLGGEITGLVPELSQLGAQRQRSLSLAEKSDGFVVDFYPISEGIPRVLIDLPDEWQQRFVTSRSTVSALFASGRITVEEQAKALLRLPHEPDAPQPRTGASLFLDDAILGLLAEAEVLAALCGAFVIYVEDHTIEQIRVELASANRLETLRVRVRALVDRIRSGFESGKWQVAALRAPVSETPPPGLASRCIHEFLLVQDTGGESAVWIDDRLFNAHVSIGKIPIVTVLGVLQELRRTQRISDADFFSRLHVLRTSEVRYLPVTSDELLWHLRRAPVAAEALIETPELATLRRYVSLCLLDRDRLQTPSAQVVANRTLGEAPFVINLHSACIEALRTLWYDPASDLPERSARADWLLDELWFDTTLLPTTLGLTLPGAATLNNYGAALSQLYTVGLLPEEGTGEDASNRSSEFFERLRRRTPQDSETLRHVCKWLKTFFDPRPLARGKSRRFRVGVYKFLQTRYFLLPKKVRRSLQLDDWQAEHLGVAKEHFVTIGPHDFRVHELATALANATNGKEASLQSHPEGQVFRLSWDLTHDPTAVVLRPSLGGRAFRNADAVFAVLRLNTRAIERFLQAHRGWFEGAGDPATTIQRIARISDLGRRLLKVMEHRKRSVENHYAELQKKTRDPQALDIRDFRPPCVSSIIRHLRLTRLRGKTLTPDDYDQAAVTLRTEVGLTEALRRLSTLPVRLSETIREHVRALSITRLDPLLSRLDDELTSPVGRLHLFDLYLAVGRQEQAVGIVRELLSSDGQARFDAFASVLNWCAVQFRHQAQGKLDENANFLLAVWHHAARLQHLLAKTNSHQYMASFFKDNLEMPPFVVFEPMSGSGSDAIHPRVYSRVRHVMLGVAASFPTDWSVDDVPEDLRGIANELVIEDYEGVRAPNLFLLQATGRRPNVTSSYLGGNRAVKLAGLLGSQAESFSDSQVIKEANAALNAIIEDPNNAGAWMLFSALFAHTNVPLELRPAFEQAVEKVSFVRMAQLEQRVQKALLLYLSAQMKTGLARDHVREEILALAKIFADRGDEGVTSDAGVQLIVECAHQWSVAGRGAVTASFAALLSDILDAWPAASASCWALLRRFVFRLPLSQQTEIWPVILKLRSLSWRVVPLEGVSFTTK